MNHKLKFQFVELKFVLSNKINFEICDVLIYFKLFSNFKQYKETKE